MSINNKSCKVEGCDKKPSIKSSSLLCGMHHYRWRIYKSYELPLKEAPPQGYVYFCKIHDWLTKDQTALVKNRKSMIMRCKACRTRSCNAKARSEEGLKKRREFYIANRQDMLKKSRQNKLRKYKLTEEDYNALVISQKNLCAICKNPEVAIDRRTKKVRNLAIDHCHKSYEQGIMKVRGLLCGKCNIAFGLLNDSVEIIQSALDYAKKHSNH